MKTKRLTGILLSVVLAFSVLSVTGCGDKIFNGSYKVASAEEILTLKSDLCAPNGEVAFDEDDVKDSSGYEISLKFAMNYGDGENFINKIEYVSNGKVVRADGKVNMLSSVKTSTYYKSNGQEIADTKTEGNIYYDGEYAYASMVINGSSYGHKITTSYKNKEEVYFGDVKEFVGLDMLDLTLSLELYKAICDIEKIGGKVEIDFSKETQHKVKLSVDSKKFKRYLEKQGESTYNFDFDKYEMVFVYNNQTKEIVAIKYAVKVIGGKTALDVDTTIKPFSGSIQAPRGLEEYKLGSLSGSFS